MPRDTQTRTTIDVLFITMTGYVFPMCSQNLFIHMYVNMKYLTNCSFVLIILNLLTINIKGNAIHIKKKTWVNYNTHFY
jgi:hypothetical protein